jgi:hypothetical protein
MPFDGAEGDKQVLIINRMLSLLAKPDHWTKGNDKVVTFDGYKFCLKGALIEALFEAYPPNLQYLAWERRVTESIVRSALDDRIQSTDNILWVYRLMPWLWRYATITSYNDAERTTHDMIVALLLDVRDKLLMRYFVSSEQRI